jgi:predicted O-methyltransferase YrrM
MEKKMEFDITHLKDYSNLVSGPVQSDEALLLFSIVKVINPRVIVEFGFSEGHSSLNFLRALSQDGFLYSFDCSKKSENIASLIKDQRFKFVLKRQEDFHPSDIDYRPIDILFIDASHDIICDIALFEKIDNSLNENALIIIHDTGTWNKKLIPKDYVPWIEHMKKQESSGDAHVNEEEFAHQPDERRFVNYLKVAYPDLEQIHFHSLRTIRHGLTILQKYKKLPLGSFETASFKKVERES